MVILSYPLQLDPSRRCLTSLIYALIGKREQRRQREQMRLRARAGLPPIDDNDDQDVAIMDEATEETVRLAQRSSQSPNPSLSNMDPVDSGSIGGSNILVDPVAEIAGDDEYLQQFLESVIFYGITCAFLVLSFTIAMIVSDLGVILGVVGATGSTMVSYILPGEYKVVKRIVSPCSFLTPQHAHSRDISSAPPVPFFTNRSYILEAASRETFLEDSCSHSAYSWNFDCAHSALFHHIQGRCGMRP